MFCLAISCPHSAAATETVKSCPTLWFYLAQDEKGVIPMSCNENQPRRAPSEELLQKNRYLPIPKTRSSRRTLPIAKITLTDAEHKASRSLPGSNWDPS